jgi:peptidoglycan/xylan/chitin deacetylase (PgdA/CDA1 family)
MRLFSTCFVAGWIYPDAVFRIRTNEKLLFLTFDDGPNPDSTLFLLDLLDKYEVKALFFCKGASAEKFPDLVSQIRTRGHLIGNHGYNHIDGWTKSLKGYISDVSMAAPHTSSAFFRPPYGHIRLNQYRQLKKTYKIIFWDIMPYDFDTRFGRDKSLKVLKERIRPGSIIVLHDIKENTFPGFIEEFILFAVKEGYRFGSF